MDAHFGVLNQLSHGSSIGDALAPPPPPPGPEKTFKPQPPATPPPGHRGQTVQASSNSAATSPPTALASLLSTLTPQPGDADRVSASWRSEEHVPTGPASTAHFDPWLPQTALPAQIEIHGSVVSFGRPFAHAQPDAWSFPTPHGLFGGVDSHSIGQFYEACRWAPGVPYDTSLDQIPIPQALGHDIRWFY